MNNDSDSKEQRAIEAVILKCLSTDFTGIQSHVISSGKTSFQIDGYAEQSNSYFEFYAGIYELKPGQKRKLACDVLKLITVEKIIGTPVNKFLVLIDHKIEQKLLSDSWFSKSIELFDIKIIVIDVGDVEKNKIQLAKTRQKNPSKHL